MSTKNNRKTTVASPILNIQSWELFNHVMIPIRNILIPAVIHTAPAVMSKICLLTPYFIRFTFFAINGFTAYFVESFLMIYNSFYEKSGGNRISFPINGCQRVFPRFRLQGYFMKILCLHQIYIIEMPENDCFGIVVSQFDSDESFVTIQLFR